MIFEHNRYQNYLKQVLVDRIQKNSNYSLRAFAAQIGIAPGMLSEVLSGQKNISAKKALAISSKLNLNSTEESYFVNLVQLSNSDDVEEKEKIIIKLNALSPQKNQRDLTIDHFHSIANWICAAGFTLLEINPKGMTAKEIGQRLNVTSFEAEEAMDRWVQLDLVEKVKNGKYTKITDHHMMMASKAPDGALRKFHQTMIERAIKSLEEQTNNEKFVGSETLAFDPKDLPEITQIIEEAVSKILTKAKKGKQRSEVYHMGFQFFKLTKGGHRK